MIKLHRIRGEEFWLNADLLDTMEQTHDTVLSLTDGRRVVVMEDPEQVVEAVRQFRASILVVADELRRKPADLVAFPGGAAGHALEE